VSVTALTLALLGAWRVAGHLLVVALGGLFWVSLIKLTLQRPRPVDVYEGISAFAFPSGHATTSIVVYGFLGFLLIRGAAPERRTPIAAPLLALIVAIAFSRIYLGVHWVSDVLAGVAFGGAWVALSALLHLRWQPAPLPFRPLALAVAVTLAAAGGWHIAANHEDAMARYTTST
ncbi:MAG: phosphatase PAP2 family protein, partial [Pseudomonadota bacterium]